MGSSRGRKRQMASDAEEETDAEVEPVGQPEDADRATPTEEDMEEQLCAQATVAHNEFVKRFQRRGAMDMALNRHAITKYLTTQRLRRAEYPIAASIAFHNAMQGLQYVQTSEMPGPADRGVKRNVKVEVHNPRETVRLAKRSVVLPRIPPIPTATMWTALSKNYEVEDEPTLKFLPYFGDDDEEDVVSEFYHVKQQRTSACEVEHTKELCEFVLKTLQHTWDLTSTDLHRVATTIDVEEEVLIEVGKKIKQTQRAAKKKRRMEALSAADKAKNGSASVDNGVNGEMTGDDTTKADDSLPDTPVSMERYFQEYEKSADSYRSLFCRRCCVYDCDYHGCVALPKLQISEQNAISGFAKEREVLINTGRNCGNQCFLGQTASSRSQAKARAISATFGWDKQTRVLCARVYFVCAGNFCEMAKVLGDKTCQEVAELCEYFDINDRSVSKERRSHSKSRRKKRNTRMSMAHLQNSQNGVVNSVQVKIEPCAHAGACDEKCSCHEDGVFCSKNCNCVHEDCKIFFRGCRCKPGSCRTKACPCYAADRECDLDLCTVCCADEIAARKNGEPYDGRASQMTTKGEKRTPVCQNRNMSLGKQKHVRMGRSKVKTAGWGLYVDDFVAKGEFIIEYIGEMVSQEEAERRGAVYDKLDRSYLFNLDTKTVIDSTRKGNKTRFINHSSKSPNCSCRIINVSSDFRIGLYALHDIQPHTELFFNYGYDKELHHAELLKQATVTEWM